MSEQRILDKIKKCLALSQSSEPHEAAAALRQAQKLMEIHGITQVDLQLADIAEAEVRSTASVSKVKGWELNLLGLVAAAFGCKLIWVRGNSHGWSADEVYGHYVIIGLKSQVPIAEYTATVLLRKLRKARAEFVSTLYGSRSHKIEQANGFCLGWVHAIAQTVHKFSKTSELEDQIQKYQDKHYGSNLKDSVVDRKPAGHDGWLAGRDAAGSESLNRPMDEVKRARLT